MKQIYSDAIRCGTRRSVLRQTDADDFGDPAFWLAMLAESLLQAGQNNDEMAEALRNQAFDQAPATGEIEWSAL